MGAGNIVIPPPTDPSEDDPSGMLKVLEKDAADTLPLESGMKALLSGILIAGVAKGSEGLDEGMLSGELGKSPGTVLGALV